MHWIVEGGNQIQILNRPYCRFSIARFPSEKFAIWYTLAHQKVSPNVFGWFDAPKPV